MLQMLVILALNGLFSTAWASLNLHGTPLFAGETSFTFTVERSTVTRGTPCYVTSGEVSQCRRKRGMEEKPLIMDSEIAPSAVFGIQPTAVPRALRRLYPDRIVSSFDDAYFNSQNIFRQIAAKGRSNVITVGDCGLSTVNLSQFLSCLGMTVQETTTLTATFTETQTLSSGYTTMTVLGCTPAGFPYLSCPAVTEDVVTPAVGQTDAAIDATTTTTTTTIQPTSPPSSEPPNPESAGSDSPTLNEPASIVTPP